MPYKSNVLLLFILIFSSSWAFAGPYTGRVLNDITQEGIPNATLTSISGESTKTDAQGFFIIECRQAKILVQMPGFEDKIYLLQPAGNEIRLELRGVYEVAAVKVRAKPDSKKAIVSKQRVQKEAVKKTTTSLFPDVARVVQSMPGVTTDNDFSSLLYVRGGAPDEVAAMLDDMIIMNPYLWGGRLSVFNPNLVESVDFYAGGYPAEANQAMSALMDIKNKTGNPDEFEGFVDLSAATADVVVEGPLGVAEGSSFIFGLRRTHYDLVIQAFSNDNVKYPFFYDGQAKLFLPCPKGSLTLQSLFSYEGMNLKLSDAEGYGEDHPAETRFNYLYKRSNTSVAYEHHLSDAVSITTLLGLRWEDGFFTFSDLFTPNDTKIDQAILQVRHVWQLALANRHLIKAGFYGITGELKATVNSTYKVPTLDGYHEDHMETKLTLDWPQFAGFFVQDDYEALEDCIYINPGVNAQYYSENKQWVVNPRLAVKWKLTPAWEWHVATGVYSQHPMDVTSLDKKYGNPDLKAQESIHYILGTRVDIAEEMYIQIEGFYKNYQSLIVSDPDPAVNYTNQGVGKAYGFDVILQKKLGGNWDGWLTYSYVSSQKMIETRSNAETFGLNPSLEPLREWYPATSERPHALSLILNYEVSPGWKVALTQKYLTGTSFTPVIGADYVTQIDEFVPRYGAYNSERLPDYYTTDIKFSLPFFGLNGWSAYVQASNLLNIKNVDQYYYSKDFSQRKTLYQLPQMFIGGIRWEF